MNLSLSFWPSNFLLIALMTATCFVLFAAVSSYQSSV